MTRTSPQSPVPSSKPLRDQGIRRTSQRAAISAILVASAVFTIATTSRADEAETLLKDGKALMKEGKLADACPKLEESQKLSPRAATLIEVAACHEKQGKIATAWSEYIDAEADARKEGRKPLEKDAQARSVKIEGKIPRVTITVPSPVDGMEIKIDGVLVAKGDWGKPRPVDPGDHKLTATAPNKKDSEQTFSIKIAEKKSVAVNALVDGTPSAPAGGTGAPDKPKTDVTPPKPDETPKPPPEPEKPAESYRKPKRWVGEIGVAGGFLLGEIPRSSLPGLSTYDYEYFLKDAKAVVLCGDDNCRGIFHWAAGGYVGGQAFFGYALSEDLQLGGRVFGAPRIGGGFVILGGPSISVHLSGKPLWLGATLVVGGVQQSTKVLGIKGVVPDDQTQYNDGLDEVDVPPRKNTPAEAQAGTFSFGLSAELSYVIKDMPGTNWTSGAIVASAWPTFVKGLVGFAVAVPVGVSYRFY